MCLPFNVEKRETFVFKYINPFIQNGLFYLNSLDQPISNIKGIWLFFIITRFQVIKIPVFNANSVDPDQTRRSAASDLGLHCLPMSLLRTVGINGLRQIFAVKNAARSDKANEKLV